MRSKTDGCLRGIGSTTVITEEGEGSIHSVLCLSLQSLIETNADKRDLRASIRVERHEMSEMPGSQGLPNGIIQNHSYRISPFCI